MDIGFCPRCGSDEIELYESEAINADNTIHITDYYACHTCGRTFIDEREVKENDSL